MERGARVFVAGETTMGGAAIVRELLRQGSTRVVHAPSELDLTDAHQVDAWFAQTKPEYVFVAAGKSGGIHVNQQRPAEFMRDGLLIAAHMIHSAFAHRAQKLLYLGSSCSYPRACAQPMSVALLMTGRLEPTSEPYALAKLAGLTLCQAYRRQYGVPWIAGIPGDAFGPGDDFDPASSHVVAALIRKMHEAKLRHADTVAVWGSGSPRRGFIYVSDLADACLFVMRAYDEAIPINLAGPCDLSIREAAHVIKEVVGYRGQIRFDPSQPDGMPRKVLDARPLQAMGWAPRVSFRDAIAATYEWYAQQHDGAVPPPGLVTLEASR